MKNVLLLGILLFGCSELEQGNDFMQLETGLQRNSCQRSGMVLAHYYGWFHPEAWRSYGNRLGGDVPALGVYDSLDENILRDHISQAKAAGLDGFIFSWQGAETLTTPWSDKPDMVLNKMLPLAAQENFCIATLFEVDLIRQFGGRIEPEMRYLAERYFHHPQYIKIQGKPALFFWKNERLGLGQWQRIKNQTDAASNAFWVAEFGDSGQGLQAHRSSPQTFNGVYYYSAWWGNPITGNQASLWRQQLGQAPKFATLAPGFNPPPGDSTPRKGKWINHGNPAQYYRGLWQDLLRLSSNPASTPEFVTITSFNEWGEGTYIENSRRFGNQFNTATAQYVRQFKQSN